MSEEKKRTWHTEFFTPHEMSQFEDLGKKYSPEAMKAYQDRWAALIAEVENNLDADPTGPVAQDLARRWEALFNEVYGSSPHLKDRIGQAYASGRVPQGLGPSPRAFEFIRKATQARSKK